MKPELSEKMLAAAAGWPVVQAARKIRDSGKVSRVSYEHPVLKGAVRSGSRTYGSGLRLGDAMENLCGCYESWSEGTICAHSVAVALVAIAGPTVAVASEAPLDDPKPGSSPGSI
jgi:hypothetical protein